MTTTYQETTKGHICNIDNVPKYFIKQDTLGDWLVYTIVQPKGMVVRLLPKLENPQSAQGYGHETLEAAKEWIENKTK